MTAEIVILNNSGVALAADSAVTVGRERVWKSSNKLFHLTPTSDVAIMIFGNGDFCGVPMEVLIKEFRKSVPIARRDNLVDYADAFTKFLPTFRERTLEVNHDDATRSVLKILVDLLDKVSGLLPDRKVTEKRKRANELISQMISELSEENIILNALTRAEFEKILGEDIDSILKHCFTFSLTKSGKAKVIELAYEISRREVTSAYSTGVVFAGFGEQELLPCVHLVTIDGAIGSSVRTFSRTVENLNRTESSSASVLSFAQSDLAHMFMEGASEENLEYIERGLISALNERSKDTINRYVPENEKIVETKLQEQQNAEFTRLFMKDFKNYRSNNYSRPIMRVVASLPKDEMAAMATALVETTSLRRKMDSRLETVGGPVDVAIVSKSDGFVWVKRKHYFNIDLNLDFMERRQQRIRGDEEHADN